jgi:hypothetical protein
LVTASPVVIALSVDGPTTMSLDVASPLSVSLAVPAAPLLDLQVTKVDLDLSN